MRALNLGQPPSDPKDIEGRLTWVVNGLMAIQDASQDETDRFFDVYVVSNHIPTRTFDANNTTLDELADVVGTIITEFKERVF